MTEEKQTRPRDMIVPLLSLPAVEPALETLAKARIVVRRAQTMELRKVTEFVEANWPYWTDSSSTAFGSSPVRLFVATHEKDLVGFAAYDIDYRGFFGPTGVSPDRHGHGIGKALLLRTLWAMREAGYLYAIIGAVGPADFYTRVCGAMPLPSEWPNYTDRDLS